MTGPYNTRFGILPVVWKGASGMERGSGELSATWYNDTAVLTMTVKEGEPLIVHTGDFGEYNGRCADSFHDYLISIPEEILTIVSSGPL